MNKRFRILSVDDDPVNIELMTAALKDEYNILTALNGHDAISQIEEHMPDLILLDVMMPDITGFEVCKIIKADERFADIPVIFLTALDTLDGEMQGLEIGGIDYITKPINYPLLKLRVRNHIALKEQRDLLVQQKEKLDQMLAEQELQNEQLREADKELHEAEWKFRALFDNGPIGVAYHSMIYDDSGKAVDYNFIDANEKYIELTGVDPRGKTLLQAFPGIENDPFDWIGTFGKVARTGEAIHFEQYLQSNDRWYEVVGYQYKPDHFVAAFFEITERKRIEKELKETKERYDYAAMVGKVGTWDWDVPTGNLVWNDETFRLLGLVPGAVDPSYELFLDLVHQDDRAFLDSSVKASWHEKKPYFLDVRIVHKNGLEIVCHIVGKVEFDLENQPARMLGTIQDISDRKRVEQEKHELEQQFQQTQKLESLGVLAGGIAHDFNNILAIIMGYCSLTKMDLESAGENISHIEKAAERAAALCRQMLAYAGKATLTQSQVNTWMLVDEMVSMLKATINPNVSIVPDLPANIPFINGDASQLRQIVMNLIINASEAIGEAQGVIKISLAMTTITARQQEKDHLGAHIPVGGYICLEVSDTGCGMDDETKQRIFEPFYTTKFTGRGLGMSAVLGIITAHKGSLQLTSQPGQGTTFKVFLPVPVKDSTGDENQKQSIPPVPWKGSGTILLVEDEEQVRLIAKTLLKKMGFSVLEAVNGKEALELYQKNAAEITLVVTDMGMPIMDGYELFHELKNINPELPIIVSSGYGDAEVSSRIDMDKIAGVISKPYSPDQMREVLKGVLEGSPSPHT